MGLIAEGGIVTNCRAGAAVASASLPMKPGPSFHYRINLMRKMHMPRATATSSVR